MKMMMEKRIGIFKMIIPDFTIRLIRMLFSYPKLSFLIPLDFLTRYRNVCSKIDPEAKRILDIGSGALGIGLFLPHKRVVSIDIHKKVKYARGERILASALNLPFQKDSFDVVVSVDTLEHIHKIYRKKVINEMKRVGKNIVIHCPKGSYGRFTDYRVNKTCRLLFRRDDRNILEHIENHPISSSDFRDFFSSYEFYPSINMNFLYIFSILMKTLFVFSLAFSLLLKPIVNNPPFYAGIFYWSKRLVE